MKVPFDSETPSVFVICSPFQALCLVGAVLNLRITDYRVIVIFSERYKQVVSVLERFDISHECRYVGWCRWRMRFYRVTSLIHRQNKYKRLFIGDYRNETLLYFGLQYVSDGSDIVYLDDGNASIPLFDGSRTTSPLGKSSGYAKWLSMKRNTSFMKYFYTIYADIPNNNYIICKNSLSVLHSKRSEATHNKVFIIGTNTNSFCKCYAILENDYIRVLNDLIGDIRVKYPNSEIVYIPHGKDSSEAVKEACDEWKIQYNKLDRPVELFFVDKEFAQVVFGFGSSALYNLKQMFPEADVYNVFIIPKAKGDVMARKVSISNYYEKCGILQIKMNL